MEHHQTFDGTPLWLDCAPLAGLSKLRWAITPIQRIPYQNDGRHEMRVIFGTEETLHRRRRREAILQVIGETCGFTDVWSWQRRFFDQLMAHYFAEDRDAPAWVTILPQRVTSRYRQASEHVLVQKPEDPEFQSEGGKLWEHRLTLGGLEVPCEGLVLMPRDREDKNGVRRSKIAYQTISRELRNRSGHLLETIHEDWCYLFEPGEDDAYARDGKVPSLQYLYAEATGILASPLVSLCKMSITGTHMQSFSFNLSPDEGKVLDFRSMIYPLRYYLVSDTSNDVLLRSVITPGHWEHF